MDTSQTSFEPHTGDIEVLKKMEDEHLRLQRQVRAIQTDRQERTMGVHPQFRRQDQLLRVLKMEYLNLVKDLKIASTGAHKKKDRRMKVELKRALMLRVCTEQKREDGTYLMEQLDGLLHRNNKQTLQLRKLVNANMGQIKERRAQSEKRLVSSENRLETAMLRFNMVQHENKQIREEIEHMLKDRALFNQAWDKMLKLLCKGKKFLIDLFESSTVAYDLRDEWCTKLTSMTEKGKVDQMLQLQEMRDLQKAFDHEMKLFHFLARKGVQRVNKQQEEKEEMLKKKEEEKLGIALQKYNELLDEITDYAEEEASDKILESFQQREQDNFSIYQLLTEHCAESVALEKDLRRTRQVLGDRQDWNEQQEIKRQQRIEDLQEKIDIQKQKNEDLRRKVEDKDQLLHGTMEKVAEIFKMLECSMEPYEGLLGDRVPSSRWQLGLTFGLITARIKEYLELVYYSERHLQKTLKAEKKIMTASRLKKYTVYPSLPEVWKANPINLIAPADPCPACVEARWLSRVTDAPEIPFTKEMTSTALTELTSDPAYVRSDRIHQLTDCRVPSSRLILAARYMN